MSGKSAPLPEWEAVLSAAAHLQQLQAQLANPLPYDLEETELQEYKNLAPRWHDWKAVKAVCAHTAAMAFDYVCAGRPVKNG